MPVRMEHANVTVRDIAAMIRFLQTAFPDFRVRGEGVSHEGVRWVHVGTDETYIALSEARVQPGSHFEPYSGAPGVNHVAYEVDDVDAIRARMAAAGYRVIRVTWRQLVREPYAVAVRIGQALVERDAA